MKQLVPKTTGRATKDAGGTVDAHSARKGSKERQAEFNKFLALSRQNQLTKTGSGDDDTRSKASYASVAGKAKDEMLR